MRPPYRGGSNAWRSSSLFYEQWMRDPIENRTNEPVFTLNGAEGYSGSDGGTYPLIDARKTFVALDDPTGYDWAIQYLASWQHFEFLLKRCKWFRDAYLSWCDEIKIKKKAESLKKIAEIAQGDSPQALPAAKYLATADWEKAARGRGRPSQEEVSGELKKAAAELSDLEEDARRVGLTVIAGGKV